MSMMRNLVLLLLVMISISTAAASEINEKALYDNAMAWFREKSYRKAIISLQQFVRACPKSNLRFSALYNIGLSYNQLGEYLEAVKVFEKLEDKAAGTIWEARACWKKALAKSSVRMMSFTENKELKERNMPILGMYVRSDELFAGCPGYLEEHCRMLFEKSKFEEKNLKDNDRAKSTLLKILELHPSKSICCEAFSSLAALRNHEKDYDEAVSNYRAIVELSPASDYATRAMNVLRYLSADCSDYNEAIAWYKKIPAISPKSDSARNAMRALAELAEWQGRYREALRWYAGILKLSPDDEGAKNSIAKIKNHYLSLRLRDNMILQGVKPELTLFSRNIREVSLLAYKVDLTELFKSFHIKKKTLEMKLPESPCARWAIYIPDKGDHQRLTTPFEVPLEENGTYILEARADGVISRTPVIITNLSLLCASKKIV
ncbi:MAG: tetratricopeptide repeat protein [Vulcanimicrobiota bacterium]